MEKQQKNLSSASAAERNSFFMSKQDQAIVVFHLWTSLPYFPRILLSMFLIMAGFFLQAFFQQMFVPGVLLLLFGNLLLLVRGYDNRVHLGKFDPAAKWERVDQDKLNQIKEINSKAQQWDVSAIDITNTLGCLIFLGIVAVVSAIIWFGVDKEQELFMIIGIDAAVLILPHWVTGVRSILTKPNLVVKIRICERLICHFHDRLQQHAIKYFVLLRGDASKLPEDLKFRIDLQGHHKDFLGLYGQIVNNTVNGTDYPYFYVVLVAKKGYGLREEFEKAAEAHKITKEFSVEGDVEVFVIRQTTTKNSGYHTQHADMVRIFHEGLNHAENVACK